MDASNVLVIKLGSALGLFQQALSKTAVPAVFELDGFHGDGPPQHRVVGQKHFADAAVSQSCPDGKTPDTAPNQIVDRGRWLRHKNLLAKKVRCRP